MATEAEKVKQDAAASDFVEIIHDMKVALGVDKGLGLEWRDGLRQEKFDEVEELWRASGLEDAHGVSMIQYIENPDKGIGWAKFQQDRRYWISIDNQYKYIRGGDKRDTKHSRRGRHASRSQSRSRSRSREHNSSKHKASMFKKSSRNNRDNDTNDETDSILAKKRNEHMLSPSRSRSRSPDFFEELHEDIKKSKDKKIEKANKNTFDDVVSSCVAEQLSIEGIEGGPMKHYLCLLLKQDEFSVRMLKDIHLATKRDYIVISHLMLYCYFETMKRKYKLYPEKLETLSMIEQKSFYLVDLAQLKYAKPTGIAIETHSVLNDRSIDLWTLPDTLDARLHELKNRNDFSLNDDYEFPSIEYCDNFNIFLSCKHRNKAHSNSSKCNNKHICSKCKGLINMRCVQRLKHGKRQNWQGWVQIMQNIIPIHIQIITQIIIQIIINGILIEIEVEVEV